MRSRGRYANNVPAAVDEAIRIIPLHFIGEPADVAAGVAYLASTQLWLESAGWLLELAALRASYPFTARTIGQWAKENAAALNGI